MRSVESSGACVACGGPGDLGGLLCMTCWRDRTEEEQRLARMIASHPASTLDQLSDATGLEPATVLALAADGRMEWDPFDPDVPRCFLCEMPTGGDGVCGPCLERIEHQSLLARRKGYDRHRAEEMSPL